jgi:hypothetical protein
LFIKADRRVELNKKFGLAAPSEGSLHQLGVVAK